MVLETLHHIPVQLDLQQPASGLLLALGLEGQAIPRVAGPRVNASLPGEEAQHRDTAPQGTETPALELRLCRAEGGHVFLGQPRNKFLF